MGGEACALSGCQRPGQATAVVEVLGDVAGACPIFCGEGVIAIPPPYPTNYKPGMFDHFRQFNSVFEIELYNSTDELIASLEQAAIASSSNQNVKLPRFISALLYLFQLRIR